jgi:hypothetical protein
MHENLPPGESDSEPRREDISLVASTYSNPKDINVVSISVFSSSGIDESTLVVVDMLELAIFTSNLEIRTARDTSGS